MPDSVPGKLVAPEPVPPVRQYSFTDWQVNNPTAPPPGDRLDAEFDRGNDTQSQTLDWVGTSLNTDGTLRTGIVGEAQLVPGLFDQIGQDAVDQVQPLVDQVESYATQALGSANAASSHAVAAQGNAAAASQAATNAQAAATTAQGAATGAQSDAAAASASAADAGNSANHADGSEAVAQAYADVGMAWAEHMPDTIPPNILAVQGITGDHWSSRWWANQALKNVIEHTPLEGGTLTGPLYWTATGGTVPRSAQDRSADVANVLDYGADPTGALDCSAAFNAAASHIGPGGRRVSVYVPPGNYIINNQITLTDGQALFGDGPGNTTLIIHSGFNASATSVILCTQSFVDPGPMISNLTFWFNQPSDVANRSTFKTIAAGGTSANGGTGVQYPWCIATSGNCGRVMIRNVNIDGSWNGINADGAVFWIDGLRICSFNIGIAIGGTAAAGVLDWAHLSDIEFWTFGLNTSALQNVYMDGSTIAMRIGAQNGLTAQNISCFTSRLVFTSDANAGWFSFTNLSMDAGQSTIEVAAAAWLQIANLYSTSGTEAVRPLISVSGGAKAMINNWYAHNSSAHEMLAVNSADVTLVGGYLIPYSITTDVIGVAGNGTLRVSNVKLYMTGSVAWIRPVFNQYDTSRLQVDDIDLIGTAPSGLAVQFSSDQIGNRVGNIAVANGWFRVGGATFSNGRYGDVFWAPKDVTSIQVGSAGFTRFAATTHSSTAFGNLALDQHQDAGNNNTAMGWLAGYNVTTGGANTFIGSATAYGATAAITGSNNSAYGANAARNLTTGNQNLFLGAYTGQSITTGSGNIFIGFGVDAAAATSNLLSIGNVISTTGINTPATSITKVAGSFEVGSNTAAQTITLNGPVASNRLMHFQTAGVSRWDLYADVNVESGGNLGSNISIARYADNGSFIDIPWLIDRSTGSVIMRQTQFNSSSGPTIRAGTGAATGTQPSGSIWLRTDGTTANRLYVTSGGGVWAAVAGV